MRESVSVLVWEFRCRYSVRGLFSARRRCIAHPQPFMCRRQLSIHLRRLLMQRRRWRTHRLRIWPMCRLRTWPGPRHRIWPEPRHRFSHRRRCITHRHLIMFRHRLFTVRHRFITTLQRITHPHIVRRGIALGRRCIFHLDASGPGLSIIPGTIHFSALMADSMAGILIMTDGDTINGGIGPDIYQTTQAWLGVQDHPGPFFSIHF